MTAQSRQPISTESVKVSLGCLLAPLQRVAGAFGEHIIDQPHRLQQIKALQKRNAELEEENLYARKVIACRVGNKIDRFLAIETLRDAVRLRGVSRGVMFHTDQGSQFTSRDFRQVIDELGLIQSFSAKAHPYDNAVMECFFKYLKMEELNRRTYLAVEQLKQSLISYISGFYNSRRPHSHNRGLSPNLAEQRFFCIPTCPLY